MITEYFWVYMSGIFRDHGIRLPGGGALETPSRVALGTLPGVWCWGHCPGQRWRHRLGAAIRGTSGWRWGYFRGGAALGVPSGGGAGDYVRGWLETMRGPARHRGLGRREQCVIHVSLYQATNLVTGERPRCATTFRAAVRLPFPEGCSCRPPRVACHPPRVVPTLVVLTLLVLIRVVLTAGSRLRGPTTSGSPCPTPRWAS
jgi:hypothetical protein